MLVTKPVTLGPQPVASIQVEWLRFEPTSVNVPAAEVVMLNEVAEVLKQHSEVKQLLIEGHADVSSPPRRADKLGEARAANVRAALIARGIDGARLVARGVGSACPIAHSPSRENHRVHFYIIRNGQHPPSACPLPAATER